MPSQKKTQVSTQFDWDVSTLQSSKKNQNSNHGSMDHNRKSMETMETKVTHSDRTNICQGDTPEPLCRVVQVVLGLQPLHLHRKSTAKLPFMPLHNR